MTLFDTVKRLASHPAAKGLTTEAARTYVGVAKHQGRGHDRRHAFAHHVTDRAQQIHDDGIKEGVKAFKASTRRGPGRALSIGIFNWFVARTTHRLFNGAHRVTDIHAGHNPDKHHPLPAHAQRTRARLRS